MILEIQNLDVEIEDKKIIDNLNLNLEEGKIHVLMGPNGSGKSTLANALMGSPKYEITSGKILFNSEDITNAKPDERAKRGMFLSFQYPQEINGVTISNFLRQSYNALQTSPEKKLSILEFKKHLDKQAKLLNLTQDFTQRYLNEGFSGGEKKKSEILQLLTLNPKLAILDETDSGLDIDALKLVAEGINKFTSQKEKKTVLIITHYKRILEYLDVDKVFIMKKGKIIKEAEGKNIIDEIEAKGFDFVKGGKHD